MNDGFDVATGRALKRIGMDRVERACNPAWWLFMMQCVKAIAQRKEHFTTDDLEWVRQKLNGPGTPEKRAFGPLMMVAKNMGICEPTERWEPSRQYACHRRPMRVWHSRIYKCIASEPGT
jgi:hypothetical protein